MPVDFYIADKELISSKSCQTQEKVTSYTSRHTFATILKMMGESTEIISEHLGHALEFDTFRQSDPLQAP